MATLDPRNAISSEQLRLLVIAGRDSSGGAGVDADREVAREAGISAAIVVTAETRQGEGGLEALGARAVGAWKAEAEAALGEGVGAIKIGLLPGAEHVVAAAELLRGASGVPVVVDPVLGPSSGGRFLDEAGVVALCDVLLPMGCVITPNLDEAAELTGRSPAALAANLEERVAAAGTLLECGAGAVVLKGGHGGGDLLDLVWEAGGRPEWLELERVPGALRGTGCRHATSLAIGLGRGLGIAAAARAAAQLVGVRMRAQGGS
jgi:hydroxymethylpyrimidine/phosphomethylpyrimidine kinase